MKRIIAFIAAALAAVASFFGGLFNFDPVEETTTEAPTVMQAVKIENYEYAYAGFEPYYANVDIDEWNLLLVNRDYILPEDYEVTLAPCITDDPDSLPLDYRVAPHYNEMYLAALEDGIELIPVSGYRSVERQKNNFENKIQTYIPNAECMLGVHFVQNQERFIKV